MIKKNLILIFAFIVVIVSYSHIYKTNKITDDFIYFNVTSGLPIINVTLNGVESRFLLDSGASNSILNCDLFDKYDFIKLRKPISIVTGLGGSRYVYEITGTQLIYNDKIIPINFRCTDISILSNSLDIVGLIGSDFLIKNDLIIDYKNKVLRKTTMGD